MKMNNIKCPFCGNERLTLKREPAKIIFRNEEYRIHKLFYECESCKERFTNTELDEKNLQQVKNQYREIHSIPFSEQLIRTRKKYGLSAAKMSEVLGFGANIYRNYEKGEVPNLSNGTLLNLAIRPEEFLKIIENKRNLFSENKFEQLVQKIKSFIEVGNSYQRLKKEIWNEELIPNEFTGYSVPNFEKFANLVLFFLKKNRNIFKVRMNKLLFYCDFYFFKNYGYSITGNRYQAIQMGPVPFRYDLNYDFLTNENYIEFELKEINSSIVESPVPLKDFNDKLFSEDELETIEFIHNKFKDVKTEDLVEKSHNEKGWLMEHNRKGLISYQKYGFELSI